MPLPGGSADKLGAHYELLWTVYCMIHLLEEKFDSIRLEPPGVEGEGAEFYLKNHDTYEFHQVKRQNGTQGTWSMAALKKEQVLKNFFKKLEVPNCRCVFISKHGAGPLEEIIDRASRASSFEDFKKLFLNGKHNKAFQEYLYGSGLTDLQAFNNLKKIKIESISEYSLSDIIETRLSVFFRGNTLHVKDVLAQFALGAVNREIRANDIWKYMQGLGFQKQQWAMDELVVNAVAQINSHYIASVQDAYQLQKIIPRTDEIQSAIDFIKSNEKKGTLFIAGEAGAGKSSVLNEIIKKLEEEEVTYLAFRMDRVDPTQSTKDLGNNIGNLPDSPSKVLAGLAGDKKCVLIIDQLDAVSLASGRNTDFFNCISKVLNEATAFPSMRIVLSCRLFDLENDHRFKKLAAKENDSLKIEIKRLSVSDVKNILTDFTVDISKITEKQIEILTLPLHLTILYEMLRNSSENISFLTVKDLFDEFWDYKNSILLERRHQAISVDTLDIILHHMSSRQVLSIPKVFLDQRKIEVSALVSENLLIEDQGRYAFFHESFFDYCFARRFSSNSESLCMFLIGAEQGLFRRAQVRQVLVHRRAFDKELYLKDLKEILISREIRAHIKYMIIFWLASLEDPFEGEWNILKSFLFDSEDKIFDNAFALISGSASWFLLLDSLGIILRWLSSSDPMEISRATSFISDLYGKFPERIVELLHPYLGLSEDWNNRISNLIYFDEVSSNRKYFDFFLEALDKGVLDSSGEVKDVSHLIYRLPEERSDWGCEAIGRCLNRMFELKILSGFNNPFEHAKLRAGIEDDIISKFAKDDTVSYVNHVFPFFYKVVLKNLIIEEKGPWQDTIWRYKISRSFYDFEGRFLETLSASLCELSKNHPHEFKKYEELLKKANSETCNALLLQAYTANPNFFADKIASLLIDNPARMDIGYNGNSHWIAMKAISASTSMCTDENLKKLEGVVLNYYTDYEKMAGSQRWRGAAQHTLLNGFDQKRISLSVIRRLQELSRKFGHEKPLEPIEVTGGFVESPIEKNRAEKMSNKQWLQAISKYVDSDFTKYRNSETNRLIGGADQLARVLESVTEQDPERFANLLLKFPRNTNNTYVNAILMGLGKAVLDPQLALEVCKFCHLLSDDTLGRYIFYPLLKLNPNDISEELLKMTSWYATESSDPQKELWQEKSSNGSFYYSGDPYGFGINTVRGTVVEFIGNLLFEKNELIKYFGATLEKVVQDSSVAVRSCGAYAILPLLNFERDRAVRLFVSLCDCGEDALLGARTVEEFLYFALGTHFEELKEILTRMIRSNLAEVQIAGARRVCLASLSNSSANNLMLECLDGNVHLRKGLAQIYAANIQDATYREICFETLKVLFFDQDKDVRDEAAKCFSNITKRDLADFEDLIESFVKSPALLEEPFWLLRKLEECEGKLPSAICLLAETVLPHLRSSKFHHEIRHDVGKICELVIRIYNQTDDIIFKKRALDIIDNMITTQFYGIDKSLKQFER